MAIYEMASRHSSYVFQPGAESSIIENMRHCFRAGQFKCANVKLPTNFHCWEIAAHSEEWLGLNRDAFPTKPTIENGVANAPSCLQPPKFIQGGRGVEMRGSHRERRRSRRFIVVRHLQWIAILLVVCFFGWLALPRIAHVNTLGDAPLAGVP